MARIVYKNGLVIELRGTIKIVNQLSTCMSMWNSNIERMNSTSNGIQQAKFDKTKTNKFAINRERFPLPEMCPLCSTALFERRCNIANFTEKTIDKNIRITFTTI